MLLRTACLLSVLLLAACSAAAPGAHQIPYPTYTPNPTYTPFPTYTPYPAPKVTLSIVDDFFQEGDIVVVRGTVVTWMNDGESPHSATSTKDGAERFDTGILKPGKSGGHTFSQPGSFLYTCIVHEYMTGSIRVLA